MSTTQFKIIDQLFLKIGHFTSLLSILLVFMVLFDVVARYLFLASAAWLTELEWHVFALMFLFGAIYTLQYDDHVRVDVWYTKMSPRKRLWVNLLGTIIFLIPWCLIIIYTSYHYALHSYVMDEKSADPGGLPYRYVIKFSLTLSFVLLLLYAILFAMKCAARIHNPDIEIFISGNHN